MTSPTHTHAAISDTMLRISVEVLPACGVTLAPDGFEIDALTLVVNCPRGLMFNVTATASQQPTDVAFIDRSGDMPVVMDVVARVPRRFELAPDYPAQWVTVEY